ncbi:hypothetical protein HELRODRAFT_91302 [Helobdella robusta]|uniref:N(6)-L-threonylcarbamoyladenine synthase n=1 Tax=Helobdella robusta TaxID=6412 RepID=T1G822_HELRO|nr:hypothetical protein HELRODRAFT_91302 [Helobdella robusta]ESN89869.1 hypothetical protein HELRODRAFT_91302 [Helobdella robusta]
MFNLRNITFKFDVFTLNKKFEVFPLVVRKKFYRRIVLGIETSCDDTGAAIVSEDGSLLGEAINSQTNIHVQAGGIVPPVARNLHRDNIDGVVDEALSQANLSLNDIDVVATTIKPGLASCLSVGLQYTKNILQRQHRRKQFIPIHHMEAHALTIRFINSISFPYLVLLISGGHSLLSVVRGVDDFVLLGRGIDDAPGEVFDKVARRLRLKDLPQCTNLSGGQSIEVVASGGNPFRYPLFPIMTRLADCNFSFSGLKSWAMRTIEEEELEQGVLLCEGHISNLADFCATFQYMVFHHICRRVQRGLLFCGMKGLLGESVNNLVISGGVASNQCARLMMSQLCQHYDCHVLTPPPKLCTDNGIMVAWNGVELLRANRRMYDDASCFQVQPKCPLGVDLTHDVRSSCIKLPKIKLLNS